MITGLFFGLTTIDIFNVVPHHPAPNQKVRTEQQSISAGGPAANAAVAFAAFGNNARLCSGLGNHPVAKPGHSDLHQHGVTFTDFAMYPDELPVLSSIIVDSSNGDRCVVYADPNRKRLQKGICFDELLHECRVTLFDGFYLDQALLLARKSKEQNIITVLDGGSWKNGLDELLPFIDYAICSNDFAPPATKNIDDIFSYLSHKGVAHSAISRGPGSIITQTENNLTEIPVPHVKAKDTLGAGDILHGAFCHYIIDHPFAESLQMAGHSASQSCTYFGTREWINDL